MLGPGVADQRRQHRPGQRDRAEQQQTFGAAPNRHFDPDSKRPYDIEYTLGVEREVVRGVSVAATWFGGSRTTSSRPSTDWSTISDYTSFEVPNPLLNGETLTIYNLNPAKQGLVDLLDTTADRSKARTPSTASK